MKSLVEDTRAFRGPELSSDHYLVVSKVKLLRRWVKNLAIRNNNNEEVYKIYLLEDISIRNLYQKRLERYLNETPTKDNINEEWNNIKKCIEKSANEAIGTKRRYRKRKGLRIWNEELAEVINKKKISYKKYLQNPTLANEEEYKAIRNTAKDLTRKAHQQSWERFVSNIEHDIHGRQTMAYKVLKHLNANEKDTARIYPIEDEKWEKHYQNLWCAKKPFREENCNTQHRNDVDLITISELRNALMKLKNRKACGPDKINIELLKYGGIVFELRLLHLVNECWRTQDIPSDWHKAEVISLFKKGSRNNCDNYRGISLLNSAYKIYAKIINERLKTITDTLLEEEQAGFRKGRSSTDNIFVLKQLIEKRREFNLETHIGFIDFQKAFDKLDRLQLWEIMSLRGYPQHLIDTLKRIYRTTDIIINTGKTRNIELRTTQGVRQGCSISPTLFNIYIDHIVKIWKNEINTGITIGHNKLLNILLFADDLVIIQGNEDNLQTAIYRLQEIAKIYKLVISVPKTKVMAFQGRFPIRSKIVVNEQSIEQVSHFCYLGSDISYGKDNDIETKLHRFTHICGTINRTLNNKTRKDTRVKLYKTMATPVLMYGSETWTPTQTDLNKIQTAEMRFLRRVKGCSRLDHIRNQDIRNELHIYKLQEKITENREKYKEHINRMENQRLPKIISKYKPKGRRDVGRPLRRWEQLL